MAGMDWFRWHHGSVNDPKFQLVAKKSGSSVADVIALWACLLESASQSSDRGNAGEIDFEAVDCSLGFDDGMSIKIYESMKVRGLVDPDGRITSWDKRQPKREREDASFMARHNKDAQPEPDGTSRNQKEPRVEKSREEKSKPKTLEPSALVVSELTPCPHDEIISLYADILPELPQVRKWEGTRARHLKARWVWVLADLKSKGKPFDKAAGLDFFRRMFGYIHKSDFLMGRSGGFSCSLPWIVNDENFSKIIEGNYENKEVA